MRYLPHTAADIQSMLEAIGVDSTAQLFSSIPSELQLKEPLALPPALPETEIRRHLKALGQKNGTKDKSISFLGAGAYRHWIPSAVATLISRGEFLTAYTPYQPEVSQGTLQALFEFQTMVADILGMEIANASNYDGASATAEAILMALRLNQRPRILLAETLPPDYRQVIRTYLRYMDVEIDTLGFDARSGQIDRADLKAKIDNRLSCVVASTPNFFGVLDPLEDIAHMIHEAGALLITATPEPLCLALAKSPGEMGVDIATGEGRSLGNPLHFGGPSLGLFATQKKHARQIPGRIVGETVDHNGKRGYVLTLATREQHIRRERATSNICTNVNLCALAATITLSLLGPEGFKTLAAENLRKSQSALQQLLNIPNVSLRFKGNTFNEFVIKLPKDAETVLEALYQEGLHGGVALKKWYPQLENDLLMCVTDMNSEDEIECLVKTLRKILS